MVSDDHADPFHISAKGAEPEPSTRFPTAMQNRADTHDTAVKPSSVVGLVVCIVDQQAGTGDPQIVGASPESVGTAPVADAPTVGIGDVTPASAAWGAAGRQFATRKERIKAPGSRARGRRSPPIMPATLRRESFGEGACHRPVNVA